MRRAFHRRVEGSFGALMMMDAILKAEGTVVAVLAAATNGWDWREVYAVVTASNDEHFSDLCSQIDESYEALMRPDATGRKP